MRIDLHVHTQESDGALSVQEIVNIAQQENVAVLAITDHETTQGVSEAIKLSALYGIDIIPGVEFLTAYQGQEIHLLGYFNNFKDQRLQNRLKELREQRTALAFDMVKRLQRAGLSLSWKDVEIEASTEGAISKGHIMKAIYHRDLITEKLTWQKVANFFKPGGTAYLPFLNHPFEEAVDFIYQMKGLPVLAHPGLLNSPEIIKDLLSYRPIGLEVFYGYWENRDRLIKHYSKIADTDAILATGGSDYHGPFSQVQIGEIDIPLQSVEILKNYLNINSLQSGSTRKD